ncbi:MAG: hypothetical protein HQK53_06760 [Oligoflexia bacterium]|nr:hypothetical protein [Oligoflexia bacterium]
MQLKCTLLFLLLIFSSSAMAEKFSFDINIKYKNGAESKETKAKISAKLGSEFTISREDLRSTFVARKVEHKDGNQIYIEGKVYSITSGKEQLISNPQLLMLLGEEALFESGTQEEQNYVAIKIKNTPASMDNKNKMATHSLDVKTKIKEHQASLKTTVTINEPFVFESGNWDIKITLENPPTEEGYSYSSNNFVLYRVNLYKKKTDNTKELVSSPIIIGELGTTATITSSSPSGDLSENKDTDFHMELTAQKI